MASISKHNGKWRLRWRESGHNKSRVLRVRTKREAEEYLRHWELQHEALDTGCRPVRLSEICDAYLAHAREYYVTPDGAVTSQFERIACVLARVRAEHGDMLAHELRPAHYKALRDVWVSSNLARTTVNAYARAFRRMLRWAVSEELIPASVYQTISTVPELRKNRSQARESDPKRLVTIEEAERVLCEVSPHVAAICRLVYHTLARPGEICALKIGDIDRTGDVWRTKPEWHKTAHAGVARVIHFGPRAQAVLREYLVRPDAAYVFDSSEWQCGGSEKWGGQNKPYTVAAVRRAITRACDAAGVERWTPYDLKTAGATAVERDRGLDAVKALCNHTTVRTSEIYVVRDLSLAEIVAREIG